MYLTKPAAPLSRLCFAVGTVLGASLAAPAVAQAPAASAVLDEITVTSQRRAESIQSVPIAVSAFGAEDLEQRNVAQALDVMQYIPNVVAHNNTGLASANAYYIRGLGGTESLATVDAPVGTYVDEVYVARQGVNNISLFDVERVEVMRGPQGTLFGRNTTGGAINVVMAAPRAEFGGYAEAGIGNYGGRSFRGSVDLPVSDRILTKFSAYWNEDDGYVRNTTTGERLNATESVGVRAALRATLTDSLTWNLSGIYAGAESSNILNFECNPRAPTECSGRYASTGLRVRSGGVDQASPGVVANGKGRQPLGADSTFGLISSNLDFDVGGVNVAVITGYVRSELDFLVDFADGRQLPTISFGTDPGSGLPTRYNVGTNVILERPVLGLATGGFAIAQVASTDQFTQEIKAAGEALGGRLNYVTGLYYFNERNRSDFADIFTLPTGAVLVLADRVVRNRTEALAGYAQFDYRLADRWSVTAGVRYTDEEKEFAFADNRPQCQVTPLPATCLDSRNFAAVDFDGNPATPPVAIPLDQQVDLWTPRFVLNYQPGEDLRFYASATRGFKSGSQAARATQVRLLLPVGPEKLWSYELGARTDWFDRRLRVNVTAFLQENEDFQAGTAFVDANGVLNFVTRNLSDLNNRGIELEVTARPIAPLTLTAAVGYQDIEYQFDRSKPDVDQFGFLSGAAQQAECRAAIAGQASPLGFTGTATARAQGYCTGIVTNTGELAVPVRAPEWTVSLGAAWSIPLPALGATLTPTAFLLYSSDQEVGTNNLSGFRSAAGVDNFARDGRFILGSFSKSHTVLNANLTLATDDGRWFGQLYCDNCTDEAYPQSTLSNHSYLNQPRSYGLRVRLGF